LAPDAENSLAGANGSALVIHVDPDDLATDPDGASGDRIACGVLFAPVDGGTPAASDEGGDSAAEASAPVEALDSLAFSPSEVTVSPGDTIQVINTGALEHDFVVDELDIAIDLPNGEMVEIEIPEDAAPGEYEFYCSIPGHAPAGMVGILIVE
jgi:plastocyanin